MKSPDRHHPADDRLIAVYFGDDQADAEEQKRVRQHLHGCEACTWRYTELVAPLERLRTDAASEADEIFTSARLDAQRTAIRQRLEQGARASRVVPFPAQAGPVHRSALARPMYRWIAAAAAAGLLVGVSAGRLLTLNGGTPTRTGVVATAGPVRPASSPAPVQARPATYDGDAMTDEAFLGEVEAAVSRQRIAALSALDDLTPHAREAVMARR